MINYTEDLIYPYIKLSVDMPKNKVIDIIEIYIEYKSTDISAPAEKIERDGEFLTKIYDTHYPAIYQLKDVGIEDMDGDVELFIRASKEKSGLAVWTDWKSINEDNLIFEDYRFFQMKVALSGKNSKIKISHFALILKIVLISNSLISQNIVHIILLF